MMTSCLFLLDLEDVDFEESYSGVEDEFVYNLYNYVIVGSSGHLFDSSSLFGRDLLGHREQLSFHSHKTLLCNLCSFELNNSAPSNITK